MLFRFVRGFPSIRRCTCIVALRRNQIVFGYNGETSQMIHPDRTLQEAKGSLKSAGGRLGANLK